MERAQDYDVCESSETDIVGSYRKNAKEANSKISTSQKVNRKEKNRKTKDEMDPESGGIPKELRYK